MSVNEVKKFLMDSKEEFARVSWLDPKTAGTYTALCLVLVIIFGVFFMGLDYVFSRLGTVISGL